MYNSSLNSYRTLYPAKRRNTTATPKLEFKITDKIYDRLYNFIGTHPAERGVMLGSSDGETIDTCAEDHNANTSSAAYDPDIDYLNQIIKEWKQEGITFVGFCHSHPRGVTNPSIPDIDYSRKILGAFKSLPKLWLPIAQTIPDTGQFKLFPYAAVRNQDNVDIKPARLSVSNHSIMPTAKKSVKLPTEVHQSKIINREQCLTPATPQGYKPVIQAPVKATQPTSTVYSSATASKNPIQQSQTPQAKPIHKPGSYQSQNIALLKNTPAILEPQRRQLDIFNTISNNLTCLNGTNKSMQYYGTLANIQNMLKFLLTDSSSKYYSQKACISFYERYHKLQEANYQKYFARLSSNNDLEYLNSVRLIIIGTGGAASFIRNAARSGIGEFILIDPDIISDTNIGTQDVHAQYIGNNKVDAIGSDLVKINPLAAVLAFNNRIEDFSDMDFFRLLTTPFKCKRDPIINSQFCLAYPRRTIMLTLTDNFYAQARGHRLGLKFGIPNICAMEYANGIGAEVTYTQPGITPACHRCITSSRYKAYLNHGFQNNITSDGATVFAAEYLNSVIGHLLLGLAYHGTSNTHWGNMISDLGNKNLIRLRMHSSYERELNTAAFSSRLNGAVNPEVFQMLDCMYLPQTPDCGQSPTRPVCPDCKGTGNLLDSKGMFADTRKMLPN